MKGDPYGYNLFGHCKRRFEHDRDRIAGKELEEMKMTPYEKTLLRQIELCRRLEASEDRSEKTRMGAAELRARFEARLEKETRYKK